MNIFVHCSCGFEFSVDSDGNDENGVPTAIIYANSLLLRHNEFCTKEKTVVESEA